ncbi:hypothetical protein SAMN05216330_102439 [Bradyrhizobium sp. Ghvi]|uniref:hypothetical protein n=1 Tax=Bradyrhizobium sp. Ghvi TaxID=1855319 RepID=UPI0008F103E0|nr:hypothetical protein [Bradyrhizobium sp. Ghvi]SFO25875.1 hypothetical protein SAMN05216330_102439 [Bradyrhizobium sp. Ghvi]
MSKIIEAKAVISAKDNTGNVFDKIAAKFKGIEKNAKALDSIKAPKFTGDLYKELERLKLSEKELQGVRKEFAAFDKQLRSSPVRAAHYFRAIDEWKGKTVGHWREVKAAAEDADKAHSKFFKRAGHFALHAAGIGTATYAAGRAIHSTAEAYGKRGRALTRYDLMGMSDQEVSEGGAIADAISSRFPSISRTEVLDYLRSNAARLGSWERSKEVAEPYARALIANKLSGGDEHEMEGVVRALEGMGKANTSGQLVSGLNAFARAKAANPDYTGEQFRADMAAASSSKYGLSKDYLENVFPVLASHTTGFGNKLSTGLSALVGGRMTKQSKARLKEAGLLGDDGKLLDEEGYIANNFEWTQKHIKPLLEKRGVHFGEDMSEDDKGKVVSFLAKAFSARNAADLIATNLLDEPLVEKMRHRQTRGLEDMDRLQKKDPSLVWEGMMNQLKDAGVAMAKLGPVVDGLNEASSILGRFTKFAETGVLPTDSPYGRWMAAQRESGFLAPHEAIGEQNRRDLLKAQLTELDQELSPGYGLDEASARVLRLKRFDRQIALDQSENLRTMPPLYSQEEMDRWQEIARERSRGEAYSRIGKPGEPEVPLPRARNETGAMPPVQPLEGAEQRVSVDGRVEGTVDGTFIVKAGDQLISIYEQMKKAISVVGSLSSNGPGSTGKSSPDANAPATGLNTGMPLP